MIDKIEHITAHALFRRVAIALFLFSVIFVAYNKGAGSEHALFLVFSALFGAYMAMNIGANDVANNVGPAVGSMAMSLGLAIVIASVFEASGALIAGGEVTSTIKKGIIDPSLITSSTTFIYLMSSALLAGALWLNVATYVGAPVSTTHSIVGAVMGSGIAAAGWHIVAWGKVGTIVASWVISPLLGGVIAASFMLFIKKKILFQSNMVTQAKKIVPYLIALMSWAFASYLIVKGLKKMVKVDFTDALIIGFAVAVAIFFIIKPIIAKASTKLSNERESVAKLFTIPLIFAVALLSFAHGANDVANAIGPLAAVYDAISSASIHTKASIPLWVMMVGALGISIGLALYGPKLIKTVGSEITELDKIRAWAIAMSAAITVLIASQLGLPVSSTHIAIGGIFGVGFLREYLHKKEQNEKTRLVERAMIKKIITAWVITVPMAGLLSAIIFMAMVTIL